MAGRVVAAMAAAALLSGCSSGGQAANACPKPVHYDEATLAKIEKALEALPPSNILHRAMADYETERDALRFCK